MWKSPNVEPAKTGHTSSKGWLDERYPHADPFGDGITSTPTMQTLSMKPSSQKKPDDWFVDWKSTTRPSMGVGST